MKVYSAVSKAVYLLSAVPLEKQVFTLIFYRYMYVSHIYMYMHAHNMHICAYTLR